MISADHKRCSTRPSVDRPNYDLAKVFFVALRGQKEVAVAVAVLRGPPCPPWTNVLPLQFFVALRGQKKLQSPLQFSAALRVLRGQMCCRCSSSVSSVALGGQKEVAVAVAVLRGPPCPPCTNVLPLQFFVALLRQMCCRPFVGKRKLQSPLQFSAALRGPPRPSVSSVDKCAAVAVLRGPSWAKGSVRGPPCPPWTNVLPLQFFVALRPFVDKRSCSRRCSSPRPSVSLRGQKAVAVAVLRGPRGPPCPPWTKVLPLQFFVALRGPSWKKVSPPFALRGQTKL